MHKHHIIPRHEWKQRFGSLVGFNATDNIVWLTIEQHIEAHKWLWEQFGRRGDWVAWNMMSGQMGKEEMQREWGRLVGKLPKSKATREKISIAGKNRIVTTETRQKKRMKMLGRVFGPASEERKRNQSKAHIGIPRPDISKLRKGHEDGARSYTIHTQTNSFMIKNLKKFCTMNKLNYTCMIDTSNGRQSLHRGYRCERVVL